MKAFERSKARRHLGAWGTRMSVGRPVRLPRGIQGSTPWVFRARGGARHQTQPHRSVAKPGIALRSGRKDRGFKSRHSDHLVCLGATSWVRFPHRRHEWVETDDGLLGLRAAERVVRVHRTQDLSWGVVKFGSHAGLWNRCVSVQVQVLPPQPSSTHRVVPTSISNAVVAGSTPALRSIVRLDAEVAQW